MSKVLVVGAIAGISLLAAGCGRKGALLYPDMLVPAAPADVTAMQSGSAIKVSYVIPDKDRAARPLSTAIAGVKVSRRAHAAGTEVCNACTADFVPLETLYFAHLPPTSQRAGMRITSMDTTPTAGFSYAYSLTPFTVDGVEGASSVTRDVTVFAKYPAPILASESLPTEIRLTMTPPQSVQHVRGYNVYRKRDAGNWSFAPLANHLLSTGPYVDTVLERGVLYRYAVTMLVDGTGGDVIESEMSTEVIGQLADDE